MNIGGKAAVASLTPVSQQQAQPGSVLGAAFGAVASSLEQFGMAKHDVEMALRERDRSQKRVGADVALTELMGRQDRALLASSQEMQEGGRGFSNGVAQGLQPSFDEFAQKAGITDDPELLNEYKTRWEAFKQDHITKAFGLEVAEGNRFAGNALLKTIETSATLIHNQPDQFEAQLKTTLDGIAASDLPPEMKAKLNDQAYNVLASSLFQVETEKAANDQLPVGPVDGRDVVAGNLPAEGRAFLNATSSPESGGDYFKRYDGSADGAQFTDISDHPRLYAKTETGEWSSAAGRYMITASTWDDTVATMNQLGYDIQDFSPVNQDRVAWFLAQQRFSQATGKDLTETLALGTPEAIEEVRVALSPTWVGIAGGEKKAAAFANAIINGVQLGGTGHSEAPDVWNDPRFAGLSYADKFAASTAASSAVNEARIAQQKAAAAREKAVVDQMLADIAQGKAGAESTALRALDDGLIKPGENSRALEAATKQAREDRKNQFDIASLINGGGVVPLGDGAKLDAFYRTTKITAGLQGLDEQTRGVFTDLSVRQGQIPPQAMSILQGQLMSSNAASRAYAMTLLSDIYERNPAALSNQPDEIRQQVALANVALKYSPTSEEAIRRFGEMQSAETKEAGKATLRDFDKSLNETGTAAFFATALSNFDPAWFRFPGSNALGVTPDSPQMPAASTAARLRFQSNYMTLYRSNLATTNDADLAHKATAAMMKEVWSPGPFGGQLMEASPLAPGMIKPAPGFETPYINGSLDWVERSIAMQLGNPEGQIALVADPQTLTDLRTTGVATYIAFTYSPEGLISPAPMRVRAEMSPGVIDRELERPTQQSLNVDAGAAANRAVVKDAVVGAAKDYADTIPPFPTLPDVPKYWLDALNEIDKARIELMAKGPPSLGLSEEQKAARKSRFNGEAAANELGAKRQREAGMRAIQKANPTYSEKQVARVYDIARLLKEGKSLEEAKAIVDGAN